MIVFGMMSTIRVQITTVYCYEIFTRKDYKKFYTIFSFCGSIIGVMIALYFKFFSKDAIMLLYTSFGALAAGTVLMYLYPEAPRYLIKCDRVDQAIEVYQWMAKFNGIGADKVQKADL